MERGRDERGKVKDERGRERARNGPFCWQSMVSSSLPREKNQNKLGKLGDKEIRRRHSEIRHAHTGIHPV